MTSDDTLRLQALVSDIGARLRPLCSEWPEGVFDEMVQRLAHITIKYDGKAPVGSYDRRTTERLVAEMREMLAKSEATRLKNTPRSTEVQTDD